MSKQVWEPVDSIVNGDESLHADEIAITIGHDNTAMATFAWPEDGNRYAVCRLTDAPAVDMPDGPGWWGGVQNNREFAVQFTEFSVSESEVHIRWAEDYYTMRHQLSWFKQQYRDTKWYRLTMPWEATNE